MKQRALQFLLGFSIIAMLLGFFPWESAFKIEVRTMVLRYATNGETGVIGIIALLIYAEIKLHNSQGIKAILHVLCVVCIFLSLGFLTLIFLIDSVIDVTWYDIAIYKSGTEYIVVENQPGFVTMMNNPERLIYTSSPYSGIRILKKIETFDVNHRFNGTYTIVRDGKIWRQQQVKNE